MDRRRFLKNTAGFSILPAFGSVFLPSKNTYAAQNYYRWNNLLELPNGFEAFVITKFGDRMSDGYRVPGLADSMGCFDNDGNWVLLCNHEVATGDRNMGPLFPNQSSNEKFYDRRGMGGVTRIVLDPKSLKILHHNLALAGTSRNCAGGVTPWGWLTCEETVEDGHGFVFLVDTQSDILQHPNLIKQYGKMNQEAALVDPITHIGYQTEDRGDGCFYRYLPHDKSKPFDAGTLQALAIKDQDRFDTSRNFVFGERYDIVWVDIENHVTLDDTLRVQAHRQGAASFNRGEGLWLHKNLVYFSCTSGGRSGLGQIFVLDTNDQTLSLVAEGGRQNRMKYPDNLTVDNNGTIWTVEDHGDGAAIHAISPSGDMTYFGRNIKSSSELAGICFSPDGTTMFLNMQHNGLTLAVRGDFSKLLNAAL